MKLFIINGPNLNMLGIREPSHYGKTDYKTLVASLLSHCESISVDAEFYQSNHEGDLVDCIQRAYFEGADGIVINPGAYTHTSIALLDAVKSTSLPTVEVHISDVDAREEFRRVSYIRAACIKTISGRGVQGYFDAVNELVAYIKGAV